MITHFPRDLSKPAGGPAVGSIALLRALARYADLDLHVITDRIRQGEPYRLADPRCTVYPIRARRWLPGFLAVTTTERWHIARLLEAIRPDVVHVQGQATWVDPRRWPAVLTVRGIPEIDTLYSQRPFRRVRAWYTAVTQRRDRRRYRDVICITEYVRRRLAGHFTGRLHFIPNCIDDGFFGVERRPEPGRVLFTGSLIPLKNIDGLLDAARVVAAAVPGFALRLAGGAEREEYLESRRRRAAELGLADRVAFLGRLSREELGRELAAAACLVLPSFQENRPMALAEAMAAGLPAVASAVGGVPEMIEEGQTGFLVDPHRPQEIADRLIRILQDPALAEQMGRKAKARAQAFRSDEVAARTLEVYRLAHAEWQKGR